MKTLGNWCLNKQGLISGTLLIVVLLLALVSLTRFPDSFDDEGYYAAHGYAYVHTGLYASSSVTTKPPFEHGDGTITRIAPTAFGLLGHFTGYTLVTARAIAFLQILLATLLWVFIARGLGVNGWFGALLFACTERTFYAAHVFRPEATQTLMNSVLVYLTVVVYRRGVLTPRMSFARGLWNAPLVMAHGNGLSSALLNSLELFSGPLQRRKNNIPAMFWYALGSGVAILMFYLWYVRDIGGWQVFFAQLSDAQNPQAHARGGLFDTIARDFKIRWGRELLDVGGSVLAKVMRFYFYGTVFATAAWSIVRYPGTARKMGALCLGCFWMYVFVVQDKIDIHIVEMMPYFVGSLLAWSVAASRGLGACWKGVPQAVLASLILISLALCLHHTVKHRSDRGNDRTIAAVDRFLSSDANRGKSYSTIVGKMEFWFNYHSLGQFISMRYLTEHLPRSGGVLAIGHHSWYADPFKDCKTDYIDSQDEFTVFTCAGGN